MDTLKMISQEHQGPRWVIYSCQKVVIINYLLTSHILHRSIIMHHCHHIASAAPVIITVVCTSILLRVVIKCGLTILLSCSGTLCSIFYHSVIISPLTFPGHPCPPHLHHFLMSSSSHCCPCVLTVMVIVALAYAHHTIVLMYHHFTVSPACTSSICATWQTLINILQDVSLALA